MQMLIVGQIYSGVDTFLNILSVILVLYALATWFVRPDHPVYIVLSRIAGVLIAPFRPIAERLFRRGMRMDLSVWLALLAIQLIRTGLGKILWSVLY